MARLLSLSALALLTVAEVAAVLALVTWLGPAGALAVLSADVLIGFYVMRWAVRGPEKDRGLRFAAGAFIALPGLVLDLVGVALLIPGVRERLRNSVLSGTESALRRSGISVQDTRRGTVIQGIVIEEETVADVGPEVRPADQPTGGTPGGGSGGAGGMPADRAGESPGPGPRVIRGEIVSGESSPT